MAAIVTGLDRKSLLFEVVNRKNARDPVESFIMVIPPESMEIEEPQRVSREKTWGGVFEDDYGEDNLKINISGNTGGTYVRQTHALNSDEHFDGKSAFYYFRNRLMRYKNKLASYQDYDLILYDLSAASDSIVEAGLTTIRANSGVDAYVVSIDKFKLSRSKDKPLFYNYSIELTTLRTLGEYAEVAKPPVEVQTPLSIFVQLRKALNSLDTLLLPIESIATEISDWISLAEQVAAKVTSFVNKSLDVLTYPTSLVKRFLSATRNIMNSIDSIDDIALSTLSTANADDTYYIIDLAKTIAGSVCSLVVYGKSPEARGVSRVRREKMYNRAGTITELYSQMEDAYIQVKSVLLDLYVANHEDDTIEMYGYITVIADAATTMEKLAVEYYGSAELWEIIAVMNDLEDDTEIVVGSTIKVPIILQGGTTVTNNYVYDENLVDVYGTDIRIKEGRIVVTAAGDFATVSGYENLLQALNFRLQEELGSRLRLTVYGLRNSVGSSITSVPLSYILSNIRDTVIQDPRVTAVENLKVRGDGDVLYISFDVRTIRPNEVVPFEGSI